MTAENNLPTLLDEAEVSISLPNDVRMGDTLNQVQEADLSIANDMLRICYAGFGKASSVTSLTKLVSTTLQAVRERRNILNMQYGSSNSVPKAREFDPLD